MRIASQVALTGVLLLVFVVGVVWYSQRIETVMSDAYALRLKLGEADAAQAQLVEATFENYLWRNDRTRRVWRQGYRRLVEVVDEIQRRFEESAASDPLHSPDELRRLAEVFREMQTFYRSPEYTPGEVAIGAENRFQGLLVTLASIDARLKRVTREIEQTLAADFERAQRNQLAMFVVFGVLTAGLALWIGRTVLAPIRRLEQWSERVAQGEFDSTVEVSGEHELSELADQLNSMVRRLTETLVRRDELIREVERRELLEAELAETVERLEASNQYFQQFAYVASHDLQEPLRTITSYLQLIQRRYKDRLDKDGAEFMAFVTDAASRMTSLIEGLLRFSRVETQGEPLVPVCADEVLDHVLRDHARLVEESGCTVERDPLPTVLADRAQLGQLFANLIRNAITYRGDAAPRIRIAAQPDSESVGRWVFSVRDNGIGIDPEYHERIFQIFQRLHGREKYSGTGIGLAVCKRIVERHSGRIWVESRAGEGAEFLFTLRDASPAESEPRPQTSEVEGNHATRISE